QPDLRAPALREVSRIGERGRTADPGLQLTREVRLELRRVQVLTYPAFESFERGDQRFRNIATAIGTEAAPGIGKAAGQFFPRQLVRVDLGRRGAHETLSFARKDSFTLCQAARADLTKLAILSGLLIPGDCSTPLDTSTPKGRTSAIAFATLPGDRPPAR